MIEQQSGLRGFLYSGDERYLEAYQRGSDALAVVNPEAARLISGQGRVGELYLEFPLPSRRGSMDGPGKHRHRAGSAR